MSVTSAQTSPCSHEYRFSVCRHCRHVEGLAPELTAAPRRRRLMASVEDVLLSVAAAGMFSALMAAVGPPFLNPLAFGQPSPSWAPGMEATWWRLAFIAPLATLVAQALPVSLWWHGTIGKRSRGLIVVTKAGLPPTRRRLLLREWLYKGVAVGIGSVFVLAAFTGEWAVAPLAALALVDTSLILLSLDGRTLGDRIFGTRVLLKTDAVPPSSWAKLRESAHNLRRVYNVKSHRHDR